MRTAMLKTKLIEVCYPDGIKPSEFDRFENYVRPALENLLRALGRDTSILKTLGPEESAALTTRIVELHAEYGPAWLSISRILAKEGMICSRDAVRKRFHEHVKQQKLKSGDDGGTPTLSSETKVAMSSVPEVRPPQQDIEEIPSSIQDTMSGSSEPRPEPDSSSAKSSLRALKIPHSEDDFILSERAKGRTFKAINESLLAMGVDCTEADVYARHRSAKCKRDTVAKGLLPHNAPTSREAAHRTPHNQSQQNDNPLRSQVAEVAPSSLQEGLQDVKSQTNSEREPLSNQDIIIKTMSEQGKPAIDIAAYLGRIVGGPWTPDAVRERLRVIRGATE